MKSIILVTLFIGYSNCAILCTENACDNIQCDSLLTAENCKSNGGFLKENGGFCGCCDLCVQQLAEGEDCTATMLLGGPQSAECAGDLYCDQTTRKCSAKNCAMKKDELESLPMVLGRSIPVCDEDGSYAGKQCSGSQCYCVDKTGKDLGHSHNIWETDDEITCQCARDKDEYMSKKIIGRLFHCTDVGDYESVQCHGSVCYCADRKTGKQILSTGVHISAKDSLKC